MHWNHRVIQHTLPDGEVLYAIREVFYDMDDDTPYARTDGFVLDPTGVQAETLDGLRQYIEWMLLALEKPVLTPADFGVDEKAALKSEADELRAENAAMRAVVEAARNWRRAEVELTGHMNSCASEDRMCDRCDELGGAECTAQAALVRLLATLDGATEVTPK